MQNKKSSVKVKTILLSEKKQLQIGSHTGIKCYLTEILLLGERGMSQTLSRPSKHMPKWPPETLAKMAKTLQNLSLVTQMLSRAVSEGLLWVSVANSVNKILTGNVKMRAMPLVV